MKIPKFLLKFDFEHDENENDCEAILIMLVGTYLNNLPNFLNIYLYIIIYYVLHIYL